MASTAASAAGAMADPNALPAPSLSASILAPLIFLLCWSGLAFGWPCLPVGRTVSTLLCALLAVACGTISPEAAFASVSLSTLALLFGTMLMSSLLEREGFFRSVQRAWCAGIPRNTTRAGHHVLVRVVLSSGLLSALFTNDSWCVVGTPVLMRVCARFRLPYAPFLLAIATSANIGSACTPVGNPQNMLIATFSRIGFAEFLRVLLLPTLVALSLNAALLLVVFNKQLSGHSIAWSEAHMERGEASVAAELDEEAQMHLLSSPRQSASRRHSADASDDTKHMLPGERRKLSASLLLASPWPAAGAQDGEENPFLGEDRSHVAGRLPTQRADEELQLDVPSLEQSQLLHTADEDSFAVRPVEHVLHEHKEHAGTAANSIDAAATSAVSSRTQRPNLYPDLDLSLAWARAEYVRRCQLDFFYSLSHDSAGSTDASAKEDQSDSHPLTYVGSARYAAPALPPSSASSSGSGSHGDSQAQSPVERLVMQPPSYDSLAKPIRPLFTAPPPLPAADAGGAMVHSEPFFLRLHRRAHDFAERHGLNFRPSKVRFFSGILFATLCAFLSGLPLSWCALGGGLAMLLLDGVDPDATGLWLSGGIDWALLIFFSALFIVVDALRLSGWPQKAWVGLESYVNVSTAAGVALYTLLVVLGSNTVSNVPLVLILAPSLSALGSPVQRRSSWLLLSFVSTLAGNLTLVGSVANLIVVARARPWYTLRFGEYAKFGTPSTTLLITIGVLLIQLELI